jgi:hypothetical protein
LAMSTSSRNEIVLATFESQYLVGAASPCGHSISNVSSGRSAANVGTSANYSSLTTTVIGFVGEGSRMRRRELIAARGGVGVIVCGASARCRVIALSSAVPAYVLRGLVSDERNMHSDCIDRAGKGIGPVPKRPNVIK